MDVLTCTKCKQGRPQSEFYQDAKGRANGLSFWCKPCKRAQKAAYNAANRGKRSEYMARWRKANAEHRKAYQDANRDRRRDQRFRQEYGIGLDEYRAMLDAQKGVCAICGGAEPVKGRRLAVDHCHEGGRVRGLLCGRCNLTIGKFNHDPHLLRAAIDYLERTE
jgi:hypothetical protein